MKVPKRIQPQPNARFWHWHSSADQWVKITLKPGQSLEWCDGGPTDEGYHAVVDRWEYLSDRGVIFHSTFTRWRDCDGRGSESRQWVCPVDRLQALDGVETFNDKQEVTVGPPRVDWQADGSSQYDEYAESMGY